MKHVATVIIAAALTAPMSVPANAWKDFADWFRTPTAKAVFKGAGEADCWQKVFTLYQTKKDKC